MVRGRKFENIDAFVNYKVNTIISKYLLEAGPRPLPVDIYHIAQIAGIASIHEIEMIPEALVRTTSAGFQVYLQKNFIELPGAPRRRRFSLAHEIGHTFFFEVRGGQLRPRKDAPTVDRLEMACHLAAGRMLVPDRLMQLAVKRFGDFPRAEHIFDLVTTFDVSPEVIIRRLPMDGFESNYRTLALTHGPQDAIDYAIYPTWIKPLVCRPSRGLNFRDWFKAQGTDISIKSADLPEGVQTAIRRPGMGTAAARRVPLGPNASIFEISLQIEI